MFEGILKYILISLFGRFIDGVDRKSISLGILTGNLNIKNVSIKSSFFDELGFPFKLSHSLIQELQVRVPWTKLSS